jgi:predicted acyltransferase
MLLNVQRRIPDIFTTSPFTGFRIMGVMERLALCYLVGCAGFLFFSEIYYHIAFLAACIAIYLGFMYGYNVPPFDKDNPCGRV